MMKKKITEKKTLPLNFHEVLFNYEIQLDKGNVTLDLIRKLLYLFSVIIR